MKIGSAVKHVASLDQQLNAEFHQIDRLEAELCEVELRLQKMNNMYRSKSVDLYEKYPIGVQQTRYGMFH